MQRIAERIRNSRCISRFCSSFVLQLLNVCMKLIIINIRGELKSYISDQPQARRLNWKLAISMLSPQNPSLSRHPASQVSCGLCASNLFDTPLMKAQLCNMSRGRVALIHKWRELVHPLFCAASAVARGVRSPTCRLW